MIEYILYILQLALAVLAFLVSFFLIKKDRTYVGNQTLASSIGSLGIFAISIFIYKFTKSTIVIQYSIRISFICLIFSVFLLYVTIQILLYSAKIPKANYKFIGFWFVIAIIITLILVFSDWVYTENDDIATLDYNNNVFFLFASYIAFMLIYSMINLYFKGIKRNSDESKTKMKYFFYGLIFLLLGMISEGFNAIIGNREIDIIFDFTLFSFLFIAIILIGISLLRKK